MFVSALTSSYLKRGLVIPSLVKVHNPAGNFIDNSICLNMSPNTQCHGNRCDHGHVRQSKDAEDNHSALSEF